MQLIDSKYFCPKHSQEQRAGWASCPSPALLFLLLWEESSGGKTNVCHSVSLNLELGLKPYEKHEIIKGTVLNYRNLLSNLSQLFLIGFICDDCFSSGPSLLSDSETQITAKLELAQRQLAVCYFRLQLKLLPHQHQISDRSEQCLIAYLPKNDV